MNKPPEHFKNLSLENIENELWVDIDGYERSYQVSNMGRIKRLEKTDRIGHYWEEIIVKSFSSHGYRRVGLTKDIKQIKYQIHRLVAKHFISNPNNLPQVNHKFGIRWDNRATELEWSTSSQNHKHAYTVLKRQSNKPFLNKFGDKHFNSIPILKISIDGHLIGVFGSQAEAARFYNLNPKSIEHIRKTNKLFNGIYLK